MMMATIALLQTPPDVTAPSVPSPAEEQTTESATSVVEKPTETPHPTTVSTLPTPPEAAGLPNTLILYSTIVDMRTSPNRPPDVAPFDDYWAFKTLPPLPFLDPTVFDLFYGSIEFASDEMARFFQGFSPQLSPDGRYLLVPGVGSIPEIGVEGTGLWLIDLSQGTARMLLPDGRFATWSPMSDAIAYTVDDTLYMLSTSERATPTPLFEHPQLSTYAHWSPDGRWIATLTTAEAETTDPNDPKYAAGYWLVPAAGGPARELTVREAFAIEYTTNDMSWSPDGRYLLVRNEVFDLDGNLLSPGNLGGVAWLPKDSLLLVNDREGLQIVTVTGEIVAHIADQNFMATWAWSRDGRRLAYVPGVEKSGADAVVIVYDLERGENQVIGTIPQAGYVELVRWSGDDEHILVGLEQEGRDQIWVVEARTNGEVRPLIDNALLIEAVPSPGR